MALEVTKKLEEEISILEKELTTELPRALKLALAMGDLRENAEYQTAKERQEDDHRSLTRPSLRVWMRLGPEKIMAE